MSSENSTPEHVYHHHDNIISLLEKDTPTKTDPSPSSAESLFDDPIYAIGYHPPLPILSPPPTQKATPTLLTNPNYESPPSSPHGVYKTTPPKNTIRSSQRKGRSLKRSKSNLRKMKSESTGDLLAAQDNAGDDYDHLESLEHIDWAPWATQVKGESPTRT